MKSRKFKKNLENNKQLAALIKNQDDFIIKITSDGRIQFINRTPAVISIKETIGQKILDAASQKQHKKIRKAIQYVLKTGKTTSYEDIDADNSIVLYKLMISPVKHGGKTIALEFIAKNMNEEKEIEVKLKDTEQKYKTLVEGAQDTIFMIDKNLKILSMNSKAASLFGKTPAEVVGASMYNMFPRESAVRFVNNNKEVFKTGKSKLIEEKMIIGDREFCNSTSLSPVKNSDGDTTAVIGIVRDITEKKKAENALKESEARYRSFIEVTRQLGWTTNPQGLITEDIPTWRAFTGQSYEEVKGYGWLKAIHPDDVKCTKQIWENAVKTKGTYEIEYRIRGHDGIYRWFLARGIPILDKNKKILEWIGTCMDITERKKAEDKIKESEENYKGLFDNAVDAMFVADPVTRQIINCNKSAEKLMGYSRAEILSMKADKLHSKELRKETMEGFKKQVEGKTKSIFSEVLTKNNIRTPVEISASSIDIGKKHYIQAIFRDISIEKKAEDALKESEEKFRNFFENSNDAIFVADAITRKLVDCNKKAIELMEYPKAKILSMTADNLHPKDKIKETMERFEKQMEGKLDINETEVVTKSGKRIPVSISAAFIKLNGKNYGIGIFRDITEKKKAEDELKGSKAFAESTLNSITDMFYSFDLRGKFLSWNKTFNRISGYSDQELSSKKPIDFFLGEDIQRVAEAVKRIYKEGTSKVDANFVSKDGRQIPCEFTGSILKDGKGNIIGFSGTCRDITERKKAEDAIRESENKFSKIFKTSPDMITLTRISDGFFVDANDAIKSILGYNREEVLGHTVKDLGLWPNPEERESMVQIIKKQGFVKGMKVHLRKKSGEIISAKISVDIIELNNKKFLLSVAHDITEENRAQEIIKTEIERMKEIDEAKTNFLNIVSHEMKTPLTAINAHLGVLDDLKTNLSEQELLSLEAIKRNNYLLKSLIDNILELSRIESGKFELNISKINLERIIREVKSNLEILSEKKGLQLILDVGKLPEILADEMRVREILNNLISNSIKFTDKGWIKVKAEKQDNHVVISIIDTGIGISKDKINNLFQKFYQIDPSIGRRFGGTGLGLVITKQLIELQGGKIKVQSIFGKGSTFSVTLPINGNNLKGGAK